MIDVRVDDRELEASLREALRRYDDLSPLMRRLAGVMLDAVEEQFAREGQPPWPPLRPSTIRARARRGHWPGKILQETGRLAASITSSWGRDEAVVGTSVVYGLYHQFGTAKMPARPFLRLTPEDLRRLLEEVGDWAGS